MMISLHDRLIHLYTDHEKNDWLLQDDGQGAYIKVWNRQESQPTQQELDALVDADVQVSKDLDSEAKLVSNIKAKLQAADNVEKLILKGMFKDLKARGIVNTVDEFISYLRD